MKRPKPNATGRNDPCPCGSGKKFKKCCLEKPPSKVASAPEIWTAHHGPNVPPEVLAKAVRRFRAIREKQEQWTARYGYVRPVINSDNWGKKFVAVGSRLYYSDTWKFIPDFLVDYVPQVFGKDWWDAEVTKPETERHPLFQWRTGCLRHRQAGVDDGTKRIISADGMTGAYLSFAFNLFAIEDNSRLDDLLLHRLKHPEQFQGALNEVFVEATCIRAGFTIEREDERDPATRHAEFTVTHKATGERFSVEAKSKHRPGVLGQAGVAQEKLSHKYGRLINDAIAKNPRYPLVIFLETNLPFRSAHHVYGRNPDATVPPEYFKRLLNRIREEHGGQYPFVMLIFTNIPHHYAAPHESDPPKHSHAITSEPPTTPRGRALRALCDAVRLYGNVPNEFPSQ